MMDQNEFILSKQIVRAGTSIVANIEEEIAAQSRNDFISKMSISFKEARETHYWLRLIRDTNLIKVFNLTKLIGNFDEIIKIIASIVKTTKKNKNLKFKTNN